MAKQSKKKKEQKGFWTLKRRIYAGLFAVVILSAVGGTSYFLTTPQGKTFMKEATQTWMRIRQKAHLELSQVPIQGHNRTTLEDINAVLKLTQGMPILEIDLEEKREAIAKLPWIRSVVIERQLPDMIIIQVTEKEPIAIWQHNKKYSPIDEQGEPIADDKTVISNVLLVVGEDAPKHTPLLIEQLSKYPDIQKHVRSAVRVGKRRWNLYLNDAERGIVVQLPETDIADALRRLSEFNETGQILERDLNVIDLRLRDRLIVRSEASVPASETNKKKSGR